MTGNGKAGGSGELFIEGSGQLRLVDKSAEQLALEQGPVECLGLLFVSEAERRAYFTLKLREKLADPEFRQTPGFPKGSDDDIIRLSDPPYFTACPNPFLRDYAAHHATVGRSSDNYNQSPFTSDLTEGKGGKVYKAHTYHTKVPHEAIARYILHYTQPGDLVLDAFAGCGMTGVATGFCGSPDPKFRQSVDSTMKVTWGYRKSILVDLSPFATFLCHNFTCAVSQADFQETATRLIDDVRAEFPKTVYGDPSATYLLWSQVLVCPECGHAFPFAEPGIQEGAISSSFLCPSCGAAITKTKCERKTVTFLDPLLGTVITQNEYQPSWAIRGKGVPEQIKEGDLAAIRIFDSRQRLAMVPVIPMMFKGTEWGDMYRAGYHFGVTHVHHFWTHRNLAILDAFWRKAGESRLANPMRFLTTSFMVKTGSRMHNIGMKAGNINLAGQIFNTLEIPSIFAERDLFVLAKGKAADMSAVYAIRKDRNNCIISTGSATRIDIPNECIDYIFIDPPFGGNIMYSEMSFLYEAWLGVFTNALKEAIVSTSQKKDLGSYRLQMTECFGELFRVLKPGRWITVAFHNSRNDVWNALQEAIRRAGFVVADVRMLDKGQGTFKQMTTAGAVEKDLAISAYRPSEELAAMAELADGNPATAWAFVREHFERTPVYVLVGGKLEALQERTPKLLFDRMVAFHVERGLSVPLSASQFYLGLTQTFPVRDGMHFLQEQVATYDRTRATVTEVEQLDLFVVDEASAIQWIRRELERRPMSFRDLQPAFTRELQSWAKHEQTIELQEILRQNFLNYEGTGIVPSQIHSYLSSNFKDLRNLDKGDVQLIDKALGRWYVPDPSKQIDLEKLRERSLLSEFEAYRASKERKLKLFRAEAVRTGFKAAYDRRDYKTIVAVAAKLPDSVLQEDEKLLMYYDVASTRLGDE